MTIAMIGQKGLPARSGGVERHVSALAAGLAERGERVIVYGRPWYARACALPAGIEQRLTSGIHTKRLDAITHGWSALLDARRLRPDVIHLHGSGTALLAPVARLLCPRAKVVVTFHCEDWKLAKWRGFGWVFRVGEWLACHTAHRTVTVSQTLVQYCLRRYGCQPTYIPHPFQLPSERPSADRLIAHGLTAERYLLFVGRLIADKQAHVLIAAFELARHEHPELFQDIQLVLVGGVSWADAYAQWLSRRAALVPGVKVLGERVGDELACLQAHALGHVFPTSSEGLSIAILEAAAYARQIVMTNLPQNLEATGGRGIIVPPHNVVALSRGLVELVAQPQAVRERQGRELYQHVARAFNFSDRMDDMVRLYREACAGESVLVTPLPMAAWNVR